MNKNTASIFAGTNFEYMARNASFSSLVFTGIATEMGVESSARHGLNLGFLPVIAKEAELAEPGCKGLIFLPYLIGERSPHMDPNARGGFFGLTFEHGRPHFIRAVMEGVVYALRDCLEIFKGLGIKTEKVIARGGGSRSALWRQIQADIFNAEVVKTEVEEEAAFGAALLAGIGVNVYHDFEEACEMALRLVSSQSSS